MLNVLVVATACKSFGDVALPEHTVDHAMGAAANGQSGSTNAPAGGGVENPEADIAGAGGAGHSVDTGDGELGWGARGSRVNEPAIGGVGGENASGGEGSLAGGRGQAAGEGGQAGVDVPDACKIEQAIIPECRNPPVGFATITLQRALGIGVSAVERWGGFNVYASKADSDTMGVFWGDASTWVPWACFDSVPRPDRVAATKLNKKDAAEVFVTTACGQLYARRMMDTGNWEAWMYFGLPASDSWVTDVASSLSPTDINILYVADRGRVFVRHRVDDDAYAAYGVWTRIESGGARNIAAGLRPDGRQQLFVIDDDGEVSTCIQTLRDLDSPFERCVDFDSAAVPKLIDIDVPQGVAGGLLVFGLDEDGALWIREQNNDGVFARWRIWRDDELRPPPLAAIGSAALRTVSGLPLLVLATGKVGGVFGTKRINGVWGPWELLPP